MRVYKHLTGILLYALVASILLSDGICYSAQRTNSEVNYTPALFLDASSTKQLKDWKASAGNLRSPWCILNQQDTIYVKIKGPKGKGNNYYTVRVRNSGWQSGHFVDLPLTEVVYNTKVSVYKNLNHPLRIDNVGTRTENGTGKHFVCLQDENVVTFKLLGPDLVTELGNTDIMLDRGEFASCGIQLFYNSDRPVVRNGALTQCNFFDSGDRTYANEIGGPDNPMASFIKNVGASRLNDGEADILSVSCHGDTDGLLYDDRPINQVILNPGNINNNTDWRIDVDWVLLAACSTLNTQDGGLQAWRHTMQGNPRRVHGILSACRLLDEDLSNQLAGFWTRLKNGAQFKAAYVMAMSFDGQPQPYAVAYYHGNRFDKLREITADVTAGEPNIDYISIDVLGPTRETNHFRENKSSGLAQTYIAEGKCNISSEIPETPIQELYSEIVGTRRLLFPLKLPNMETCWLGGDGQMQYQGATLDANTQASPVEDSIASVNQFIENYFPEEYNRAKLEEINYMHHVSWVNDVKKDVVTGYTVNYSLCFDNIPIDGDGIRIMIAGSNISAASFKSHTNLQAIVMEKSKVLSFVESLRKNIYGIKTDMGIMREQECTIKYISLIYMKKANQDINKTGDTRMQLAWKCYVEPSGDNRKMKAKFVYIDAVTGKYLFSKGANA